MAFFKKYREKYFKSFLVAVMFLTFEAMCDLMQPTIMSKIIDKGVTQRDIDYVFKLGILMVVVTGIGALAALARSTIASHVSQKFGADLRLDLFKKINSFSFSNKDNFDTASLVTRLTNDVTQVQNFVNGLMRIFVKAPILCIGSIIMAIRLNPSMSVILIVIIPIISIFIALNMKVGYPFYRTIQKSLDKVNSIIREYLSGVRVVKAFNRFQYEVDRFKGANDELADVSSKAMKVMAVFSPSITLTVNLGIVIVLWVGGLKVDSGDIKVGQIIAFTNYMTQILFSLMMISFVFTTFVRAKASTERIVEVLSQENDIEIEKVPVFIKYVEGNVEFKDVTFAYDNNVNNAVLKNISFKCNKGETLGIIGSTGSGKSSLVNLIPRFYDTLSGQVMLDGVDVKAMETNNLIDSIAMVPQKSVLFTGTIKENICFGKENASIEEINEVAEIAQAHEFIAKFPEGYNTVLGQGGANLSGGQKQRLSIARALIKRPKVLILDDCTSAVDVSTEEKIRDGFKSYLKDMTCIVIAQRITSVMNADRIIVLDDGAIVGNGTHKELLESCNVYKDIFYSQIGKEMI